MEKKVEEATFGGGCFWCLEEIFSELKGVKKIVSGYSGGILPNPTYKQVCSGKTGHAEVVQITFDSSIISYEQLLRIFFTIHDPTILNRQGNDIGTQYRSVIFYHNKIQKISAEKIVNEINKSKIWDKPIVTELVKFDSFYLAEDYHQNYFKSNKWDPYCMIVIKPKVIKFRKKFIDLLKND